MGNKSDMADEKRAVPYAKGQALADEYGIKFFETSAKDNLNVEEVSRQDLAQQYMYSSCTGPQTVISVSCTCGESLDGTGLHPVEQRGSHQLA